MLQRGIGLRNVLIAAFAYIKGDVWEVDDLFVASMDMLRPLCLKMRHTSFLMCSRAVGVVLDMASPSVRPYVEVKVFVIEKEGNFLQLACFRAVLAAHCSVKCYVAFLLPLVFFIY